jgi:hypothetical protein
MRLLAFGITLDEAKLQGLLGECPDGYLGLAKSPASSDTVNLMKDINRKRRGVYQGIAKKWHGPLSRRSLLGKRRSKKLHPDNSSCNPTEPGPLNHSLYQLTHFFRRLRCCHETPLEWDGYKFNS